MTEFRVGIFETIKELLLSSSIARAAIYTMGHIIIAMACNNLITGAEWRLAAADAIVEPLINGVWYFILDKCWYTMAKSR
jgi:uncharacterized membrane protein